MNVINEIKTLLGMEVKLAQMKLKDGVTVLEADAFEMDNAVFIVNGEERIPVPVGEYELEDGMILVVTVEGVIAEIKEPVAEEEAPEAEVAPVVAGINSQLEAINKEISDMKARFSAQTLELNETKKGLGIALSSVEKLTSQPVAISLEKQKPSSKKVVKPYAEMSNHEQLLFNKGKL